MSPELKAKWIEALRSGKYKQGRYYLKRKDGSMCCWGVAAEVMGCQWKPSKSGSVDGQVAVFSDDPAPYTPIHALPKEMVESLGVSQAMEAKLMQMNDYGGYTFEQIADFIEQNL